MPESSAIPAADVYLASGSPRRQELLRQIGVRFELLVAPVDESRREGEAPAEYVQRLALDKARAGRQRLARRDDRPVLGADTTVVLQGRLLGKPGSGAEAVEMLLALAGRTHEVLTGIALCGPAGEWQSLSRSEVSFGDIDATQAQAYWDTGEPADKAGGYAIQGYGARFVRHLSGSYSGVMGLPLYETAQLLVRAGIALWRCA